MNEDKRANNHKKQMVMKQFNKTQKMAWRLMVMAAMLGVLPLTAQRANAETSVSTNEVTGIAMKGKALWLATKGGLVKYDPVSNKGLVYNVAQAGLPEDNVVSVAAASDGVLAGTASKGIAKVSGDNVQMLSISGSGDNVPSYQNNNAIATDAKGNIWVAQHSAFYKFDGKEWTKYSVPGTELSSMIVFKALTLDPNGTLWFGGSNSIGSNGLFGSCTSDGGIKTVPGVDKVNGIAIDAQGNKWAATGEGLVVYDGKVAKRFTVTNSELPSDNVAAVAASGSKIWAGAAGYVVEYSGGKFQSQELPDAATGNRISALLADGDILWIGTTRGGLYKLSNGTITHVGMSLEAAKIDNVRPASPTVANNQEVWIGTKEGLIRIDKDNNITKPIINNSDTATVVDYVYADSKGNVWVALDFSDTCLLKISGEGTTAYLYKDSPVERGTISMLSGSADGTLYVATGNGLLSFNGTTWRDFNDEESPVKGKWITNVATDSKGNVWCALKGIGLYKYDGTGWTPYTIGGTLPAGLISALGVDKADRLWVATGESGDGLACYDGSEWNTYTTGNSSLPSDTVTSIAFDNEGNLWVGTRGTDEVSRFDGHGSWQTFNVGNKEIDKEDVSELSAQDLRSEAVLNGLRARGFSVAISGGGLVNIANKKSNSAKNTPIYDLSGIRVTNPQKGNVYIQNGKKFIKK